MKIAMPVGDIYLDSSFLLKLSLREFESLVVDAVLRNSQAHSCNRVTDVEVISTLHRRLAVADGMTASQTYLANRSGGLFAELAIDAEVFEVAVRIAQQQSKTYKLKSLNILHLATAVRHGLNTLATFDKEMRAAAFAPGLSVLPA